MGTSRHIGIVLACLLLQSFSSNGDVVHQHGPVLEGANVTLTCSGTTESEDRHVYWDEIMPNASLGNIALCHTGHCENNKPARYNVSANFKGSNFQSTLTVLAINHWESYLLFQCLVFDVKANKSRVVASWNISEVLYAADSPTCFAIVSNVVEVQITCSTTKIYPSIFCDFFEIFENTIAFVNSSHTQYATEFIDSHGYTSASCSVVKTVPLPGEYIYKVMIYPDSSAKDVKAAARQITTDRVFIPSHPTAVIQQSCDRQFQPMGFFCTAYWLLKRPEFVWSMDGVVINGTKSRCVYERCFGSSSSYVDLSNLKFQIGSRLKCEAHYREDVSQTDTSIEYVKPIYEIWSHQQPYFTQVGHALTGYMLMIDKKETTVTLNCEVRENNLELSFLEVKCMTESKIVVNEVGTKRNISFSLHFPNSSTIIYCRCLVRYSRKCCYNESVDLTVIVENTSPSPHWLKMPGTVIAIVFSIAGFLVFGFLIISSVSYIKSNVSNHCGRTYSPIPSSDHSSSTLAVVNIGVSQDSFDEVPEEIAAHAVNRFQRFPPRSTLEVGQYTPRPVRGLTVRDAQGITLLNVGVRRHAVPNIYI